MKKKHYYKLDFGISFLLSVILELAKVGCSSTLPPTPLVDDTFIKSQQAISL